MELIFFPFERVIEINAYILSTEKGMKGQADIGKLQGALARIDNELLADAMRDLVIDAICETDFADILYAQYLTKQPAN